MSSFTGRWFALVVALLVALYLCWLMLRPFVDVLLWAVVLVAVFMPVHRRLLARIGSAPASAALSTVLVLVTILAPATFITIAVVRELGQVASTLGSGEAQLAKLAPLLDRVQGWVPWVNLRELGSSDVLLKQVQELSGTLANRTLGVVGGVASAIIQTFLVVFTMFYVFRDVDAIRRAAFDVLPLERGQSRVIVERTKEVLTASVYGVLVIAAVQGVLGGAMFAVLGLHSPLLWGVVMFLLSMIPMAGAFLVWVPAAVLLAVTGEWGKAIILTAWGLLVIGTIDNFLRPRLVGNRARLHELLIFFSVLGGLDVFGVLGIVLGPVTVALTLAVFDVVRAATAEQTEVPASTIIEQAAGRRDE